MGRFKSWFAGLLGLVACAAVSGCGSSYASLVSEDQVPELAALKAEAAAHPNHTALVPTGDDPPLRVAFHQVDNPDSDSLIVLVHGILADHAAWRFVAADLGRDHDLWLVDLPGCGDSDKPDPDRVGRHVYAPASVAARLLEALRGELGKREGDGTVTILAHSIGGAIVIRMFADDSLRERYADVLDRIDRLALIAPLDVSIHKMDPMFREIATVGGLKIGIGVALGLVQSKVAAATLDSVCSPDRALREEAQKRVEVLTDPARRRATQALLAQAAFWKGERPDWDASERVAAGYQYVRLPTLILWGTRDETLPSSMGHKLARELPEAELVCIPKVMHSPHIERPRLTAGLVREFIRTGKAPDPPTDHERTSAGPP